MCSYNDPVFTGAYVHTWMSSGTLTEKQKNRNIHPIQLNNTIEKSIELLCFSLSFSKTIFEVIQVALFPSPLFGDSFTFCTMQRVKETQWTLSASLRR